MKKTRFLSLALTGTLCVSLLDGCGGEAASYAFDDFGRGAMVIDDSLQYAEDVPAAMDDAIREMKHWVTVV